MGGRGVIGTLLTYVFVFILGVSVANKPQDSECAKEVSNEG
jgi:hypothetical protein